MGGFGGFPCGGCINTFATSIKHSRSSHVDVNKCYIIVRAHLQSYSLRLYCFTIQIGQMALPPKVYQFLVSVFASLGSFLFGYDLGVIAEAIASENFTRNFGNDPNKLFVFNNNPGDNTY